MGQIRVLLREIATLGECDESFEGAHFIGKNEKRTSERQNTVNLRKIINMNKLNERQPKHTL